MALALASCGGGGSGTDSAPVTSVTTPSGGATPTPTPTATPAPTPTPTATPAATPTPTPPAAAPAGTAFSDLSGGVILQSAHTGFLTRTDPPQETGVTDFGQGVRYIYDVAARSMRVENGAAATQFTAAELDGSAPAGTTRYAKADGSRLSLVTPAPGAALRWTRFIEAVVNTPEATRLLSLTGVPTPSGEIPGQGSATFPRTEVLGHAYVRSGGRTTTYAVEGSQGTLTIDYATKRIIFSMTLIGRPSDGSAAVTLVKANGSTGIDGSNPNFTVTSPIVSKHLAFVMSGALFGPSGAEVGAAFSYRGMSADGQTVLNFAGLAAGGK